MFVFCSKYIFTPKNYIKYNNIEKSNILINRIKQGRVVKINSSVEKSNMDINPMTTPT